MPEPTIVPHTEMEEAPFILEVYAFPWGVAVLDSDGMFDGLRIWLHGDVEPCLCAVGFREDLLLLLP